MLEVSHRPAVFLTRAAARHEMLEAGVMDLDDAFGGLIGPFRAAAKLHFTPCDVCGAQPCGNPGLCEQCRRADQRHRQQRWPEKLRQRVPTSTVAAVKHTVRERGAAALNEPDNMERLRRFDAQSLAELDEWLQQRGYSR